MRLVLILSLFIASQAYAEHAAQLEVMGVTPGVTSISEVKEIISPHAKRIKCKDRTKDAVISCRTKGEFKTLTLAGQRVKASFIASNCCEDAAPISVAHFTFVQQSQAAIHNKARLLVDAFTAKFGEPTYRNKCVPDDSSAFQPDENSLTECAAWIDDTGVKLSVIYRVQHDVLSAFGSTGEADHFMQVEITQTQHLTGDL